MNTSEQPSINKKGVGGIILLIIFGCFFISVGIYYISGYLMTRLVDYRYTQKDCAALIPLADITSKIFPENIAPFTKPVQVQARECQLYVQAENKYAQQQWSSAYQEYSNYLRIYPQGIHWQDARNAAANSLNQWAKEQEGSQDYQGAEENLFILRDSYADIFTATQTDQALAELYIAWARSLETSKDFTKAEAKYRQAIESDPNPSADGGPAAQARAALPELQRSWGRDLLDAKKFADAISHLKLAINLLGPGKSGQVSDELAQAYLQWSASLSASDDHNTALEKITLADQAASASSVKEQVKTAHDTVIDTFSKSNGSQARDLMSEAAKAVCTNKGAAAPSVPILGIDPEIKRVLLYGTSYAAPNSIWAGTPATSYYVACITVKEEVVQSCPYSGGYYVKRFNTNWLVEVRELLTGEIYRKTTLSGQSPESCPYIHQFTRGVYTVNHTGAPPAISALETWLSKFIK